MIWRTSTPTKRTRETRARMAVLEEDIVVLLDLAGLAGDDLGDGDVLADGGEADLAEVLIAAVDHQFGAGDGTLVGTEVDDDESITLVLRYENDAATLFENYKDAGVSVRCVKN